MDRRDFLKGLGAGVVATAALAAGCKNPGAVQAEGFELGEVPTDKMTYRRGTHGEGVSLLGYGCMRLPVVQDSDLPEQERDLDQEQIDRLTDYAMAHGVNLYDTAPRYCRARSEKAMGIALSRHPRSSYLIDTKMSNMSAETATREGSMKMFRESLERLQTDYVDFYMLHCVGLPMRDKEGRPMDAMSAFKARFEENGILEWLMEQREKGVIRNLGFSYHGDVNTFDYALSLHSKVHWDQVLIQHNYVNWRHASSLAEEGDGDANSEYLYNQIAAKDIPVFVMEPLLGGRLADLPQFAVDELKARAPQKSLASWSFRFAANQPRVLTVLSGMTYMEHLQDNIRTYSPHVPLTAEEESMLLDVANRYADYPMIPCTGCQYCMPCPYGVDIPGIFAHYNKGVGDGQTMSADVLADAVGEERRKYLRLRRNYLIGYDRAVGREHQADRCIGCGKCLQDCPQSINIPKQLGRIEKLKIEN